MCPINNNDGTIVVLEIPKYMTEGHKDVLKVVVIFNFNLKNRTRICNLQFFAIYTKNNI